MVTTNKRWVPTFANADWIEPDVPALRGMSPNNAEPASHHGAAVRYQPAGPSLSGFCLAIAVIATPASRYPTAEIALVQSGPSWPAMPDDRPPTTAPAPVIAPNVITTSAAVASALRLTVPPVIWPSA